MIERLFNNRMSRIMVVLVGLIAMIDVGAQASERAAADNAKPLLLNVVEPSATAQEPPEFSGSLGRMTMAMGVVLVLIGLTAAAGKRWLKNSGSQFLNKRTGEDEAIRIVSRQYLGNKQSLLLVQAGEALLLVGRSPQSMSTLARLDKPRDRGEDDFRTLYDRDLESQREESVAEEVTLNVYRGFVDNFQGEMQQGG